MKKELTDHGEIIHWMGFHRLFPVVSADGTLGFAAHGGLEGRKAIGWQEFFPALRVQNVVVVVDEDEGTATVTQKGSLSATG